MVRDIERVKQMPHVISVSPSNAVPFAAESIIGVYKTAEEEAQRFSSVVFESDQTIFDTLSLNLIDGRWLKFIRRCNR